MKVFQDIDHYLETKPDLPSFQQYIQDRVHYLEQIWVNVWLNKVTNDVSKQEKKEFLHEKGFEIEGINRKLLNKLFRDEMRTYQPFDTISWVNETFIGKEALWINRFERAKENYAKRLQEQEQQRAFQEIEDIIVQRAEKIIEEQYSSLYVHVRYFAAKQLAADFTNKVKYHAVDPVALEEELTEEGRFQPEDYKTVREFLKELTGDIQKTLEWGRSYFEYQRYYYLYESLLADFLSEFIPARVLSSLPVSLKETYLQLFHEPLSVAVVKENIADIIYDSVELFLVDIVEEYPEDLLKLAEIPFDEEVHREILQHDLAKREQRYAEEQEELQRKREAEQRMMADIFGEEYAPSTKGDVRYVLHIGETNTGKTHHALERMRQADSGLYLAPLRLLALEVYDKLNSEGTACSLKTGEEEKIHADARHLSCTVEMFHEKDYFELVVIDEAQMITDKDRGFSWYKAITKANAAEVHIIGSLSSKKMLLELLGNAVSEIFEYSRETPLEVESKKFDIKHVKKGDALICFSRRRVLEMASRLQNDGHRVSMIYGSMPPETRKKQIQQFNEGKTKVIVATDAIGMGLNLPIRRIVFLENEKFDGTRRRLLSSQEVKQIAGRAGRKGIYDVGRVAFVGDIKKMKNLLLQEDRPVQTFAIAPTNTVFEKFQRYYHDLGTFFELWEKFESPNGTKKASLAEERSLYQRIAGTEIEARLSLMDLYGFLHLPFSKNEAALTRQWEEMMVAIIHGDSLPEPRIKEGSLEELELSYKAIGLHLLFLYRLGERTEAIYWERVREEISDKVQERLNTDIKKFIKKCKNCGKKLPWNHSFPTCDACYHMKFKKHWYEDDFYV